MNKAYFLKTDRIGFSKWCDEDLPLAKLLWGDPAAASAKVTLKADFSLSWKMRCSLVFNTGLSLREPPEN